MELTIITPRGVLYDVQVDKASFPGTQGAFTVMSNHAPIISTLGRGKVTYRVKGETEEKEVEIEEGVVEVRQNKIRIYIE